MLKKILSGKFGFLLKEYYKYIIVGLIVTGFDFCILVFLTEILNLYHMYSGAIAFTFASFLHYYLSIKLVFSNRSLKSKKLEFFLFFTLGLVGLGVFLGLFYLFTDILGIFYIVSKVLATGISFTFNFLARKYILFR